MTQVEGLIGVDKSVIHLDLYRNVKLLAELLDNEIEWPKTPEQVILVAYNDTFTSCIIVDCMDIGLKKRNVWYRFIYKSWKTNAGYRNLLAVDCKGEIRACVSIPAGFNNDQFVLCISDFMHQGALAAGHSIMGDGAFTGSADFPVEKPFSKPQVEKNPLLSLYNEKLREKRNIVERVNGIVKMQWRILRQQYPFQPTSFPLVFRVLCMLTNRYFRIYDCYPQ